MNRSGLLLAVVLAVLGWFVIFAVAWVVSANACGTAKAPDPPPIVWPQEPCNLDHRMDVAIIEGLFFECQCLRLHTGYVCDWYLVAGVDAPAAKKRPIKRHPKGWHLAPPALSRVPA